MKIIWGLRARKVTRVMNCGCLPGFPGENRKQLLNAIVHWEGSAGGDFETFQKQGWRLQKVIIRHWTRRIWRAVALCVWLYLGRDFYSLLIFSLHAFVAEEAVMAPAVPGGGVLLGSVGGSPDGTLFL